MNRRFRAAGIHLLVSAVAAAAIGSVVSLLWYPAPYGELAGGLRLMAILVGVDLVLGPMLTAVVAAPAKPRAELIRDIGVIALIQLAAMAYGVHAIAVSRPVYVVFEVDRFRVVTPVDLDPKELAEAPASLRELPWTGPRLIATVRPTGNAGLFDSIGKSLNGADLAMQPEHWVDYSEAKAAVAKAAKPVGILLHRYPETESAVRAAAAKAGLPIESVRFLPLMSRRSSWVALLGMSNMQIVGFIPVDGFF
ncbi:MAG TPA: TfpX/TfpZ family type IV pilin accessory protein [Burkholderiaceae bacterium]|jgi:hypothetical protein